MASEVIKLNLIPTGEMPTYHCSQFDNGREILIDLYNGEDDYSLPAGYTAELHTRKMDNNIVTLATTSVSSNHLIFTSTEQLTACAGNNLSEVSIKDASDYVVGTLNFWLYVEKDPLQGGLTSTSAIHDLTDQIEDITTEIVGENYYNKTETDDLLDLKADKSTTYTKTEVNTLLNSKADTSSVYTKSETNTLLSAKADANGVYNKVEVDAMVDDLEDAIDLKADAADVYTKEQTYSQDQVNALIAGIFPTKTASGAIASFTTALAMNLVSCTVEEGATTVTRCGVNLYPVKLSNDTFSDNASATHTTSGDELVINASSSGNSGVYSTNASEISKLIGMLSGTVTYSFDISVTVAGWYLVGITNVGREAKNLSTGWQRITLTGTADRTVNTLVFYNQTNTVSEIRVKNFILESGSTAHDYAPYNGQTVPISEVTTIVTQPGVNNVFADSGNVTVQYKDTTL